MLNTESLRNNHEFKRLYYRGKNAHMGNVAIYCMKTHRAINRLGITVGVKVGNAVTRNRVRRRIKECYRLAEKRLLRGYDIVIVAKPRAAQSDYHMISRDITYGLKKLGLLTAEKRNEKGSS